MIKNQKGVTLIALVITIIVLLILAGVSITMLSGNESTPEKANEAAIKSALGDAKDAINIAATEAMQDYYDKVYVQSTTASYSSCGAAVAAAITSMTAPENTTKNVSDMTITVTSQRDNSYTVTGTINTNGGITWVNSWDTANQ